MHFLFLVVFLDLSRVLFFVCFMFLGVLCFLVFRVSCLCLHVFFFCFDLYFVGCVSFVDFLMF